MAEGLTGFTHLFNAMPQMASREPGPIALALELADACYGLIVDGVHVDPAMLRLALRGRGRPLLVTDAMPPVGGTARVSVCMANTSPFGTAAASWTTGRLPAAFSTWRPR